jgi:hypothetical protein
MDTLAARGRSSTRAPRNLAIPSLQLDRHRASPRIRRGNCTLVASIVMLIVKAQRRPIG